MPENKTEEVVPVAVSAIPEGTNPLDVTARQLLTVIRTEDWAKSDETAAVLTNVMHKLFKTILLAIRGEFDDAVSVGWAKGSLTSVKTPRVRAERNSSGKEDSGPKSLDEEFGL